MKSNSFLPVLFVIAFSIVPAFVTAQGLDGPNVTVSSQADSYAFRYAHSNKIVSSRGKTFITFLEGDLDAKVRSLNNDTLSWIASAKLGTNSTKEGANHGGAALAIDHEGILHAAFGGHSVSQFRYTHSLQPRDASAWVKPVEFGLNITYPSLVVDDIGTLHLAYRARPSSKSNDPMLYYRFKKRGEPWSAPSRLAWVGEPTEYAHYHHSLAISGDGELHVLLNFFFCSSRHHIGARSRHIGHLKTSLLTEGKWTYGGPWKTASGNRVDLPINPNTPGGAVLYHVDTTSEAALSITGLTLDTQGKPWFVLLEQQFSEVNPNPTCKKSAGPVYSSNQYLFTHNGSSWERTKISQMLPGNVKLDGTPLVASIDRDNSIYLAGAFNGGVGLLHAQNLGRSTEKFEFVEIERNPDRSYLGITLERPSNQNSIDIPWLGYGWCNRKGDPDCHAQVVRLGG